MWLLVPLFFLFYPLINDNERQAAGIIYILLCGGIAYSFLIMAGGYVFAQNFLPGILKCMALASAAVAFIMSPTGGGDGVVLITGVVGFIMAVGVGIYTLRSFIKSYPSSKEKSEPNSSEIYSKEQIFNARARAVAAIAFLFFCLLLLLFNQAT